MHPSADGRTDREPALGYQWASSLLAFLSLAMAPYETPSDEPATMNRTADKISAGSPTSFSSTARDSGAGAGTLFHENEGDPNQTAVRGPKVRAAYK